VVVLTGFGSIATALEAVRKGALNYLTKPASVEQILAAFNSEGERADITQEMPSLAQVEAEYVQRVLDQCGGNVSRSAKVLGVNRRSLQRRMKKV
jgi:two-component system response regulator RegA